MGEEEVCAIPRTLDLEGDEGVHRWLALPAPGVGDCSIGHDRLELAYDNMGLPRRRVKLHSVAPTKLTVPLVNRDVEVITIAV